MRSADIPLIPLSEDTFNALRNRSDVRSTAGAIPCLGETFDNPKKSTAFAGYCDRFDLSTEDGRSGYAALSAQLLPGTELVRLWEERVHGPDGVIYVYVSYVRLLEVYQSGTENFDL